MKHLLACCLLPAAYAANLQGAWTTWSARPETAPRCFVDNVHFRTRPGALAISGNSNVAEHGGWQLLRNGIDAGGWYRLTAWYRTEAVPYESVQVVARLDWRDSSNRRAGQPDYAYQARRDGEWTRLTLDAQAPEKASAVTLQLYLSNAPHGTVWWDDISLDPMVAPAPRKVTVAAINLRPNGTSSSAESVAKFIDAIERNVAPKTDLIVLPEGITVVGTGKHYADVAEPIPGPTTERLGAIAKKHNSYLVAGLYEREAPAIYNTAVLIDRSGEVIGKYRKVYLPREEIEGGLTPGNDYPVFQTDIGTIGLMICYDVFFADPARALVSKGADLIAMPIWGGDQTLGKARAIENKVFIIASGYDYPTYIMDPDGELLALARQDGGAATATIDLNKRFTDPWLGNMRERRMKELRVDVRQPIPGLQ